MSIDEIERLVKAFGVAAKIIKTSEFDAIEIHGHEGYLIDEFMTAKWNKRTDRYGGNLDGRLRFPLEIVESIRKAAGPDFPIIFRMGARHYIEGGRELDESIVIAKRFEKEGVHCLHIDSGCYEARQWVKPPIYMERGCYVDVAAAIKKEVKIPVIAVGRLDTRSWPKRFLLKERPISSRWAGLFWRIPNGQTRPKRGDSMTSGHALVATMRARLKGNTSAVL